MTALFLSLLLWLSLPVEATTMIALDTVELAAASTAVVDATVGPATQTTVGRRGFTETTLQVHSVLAGQAPAAIPVRQHKGQHLDGSRFAVIGDAELTEGERVVAFLIHHPDGNWYLTALNQSVWHVKPDGSVSRSSDGLELYENTAQGVAPARESLPTFSRVDELLSDVRGLPCLEGRR